MKLFDWQDYYLLATDLLSQADNSPRKEATLRSAVSRAYYAAYHRACDYLREVNEYPTRQEFESRGRETHRFIISIFKNNPDYPERYKIGEELRSLKDLRQKADYAKSVEKHIFRKTERVEKIVDRAKKVIGLIDSL
ncbi:MAG TPA: hypothetical protein VN207_07650 [Ktedonobacteraceae bacterium]|nr:hypothetical protein [Ktedonobacteraceae bacterium]